MYPNELYHYGIKGMKWGIRRYQNEDGTRTELGKKRERKGLSTAGKVAAGAAAVVGAIAGKAAYDEAKGKKMPKAPKEYAKELFDTGPKGDQKSKAERIGDNVTRIADSSGRIVTRAEKKKSEAAKAERKKSYRAEAMRMSDKELQDRVRRLNLERQYVDMMDDRRPDKNGWSNADKWETGTDIVKILLEGGALALKIYQLTH